MHPNERPDSVANAPKPIGHYENFPVASLLCPRHLRAPITAIYHFARTADDLADEGEHTPAQRLQQLHDYRQCLQRAAERNGTAPNANAPWAAVFLPLRHAIQTHMLPVALLLDLLDAFVQDIEKSRDSADYANERELLDYCRRSANPVGRLMLHLYGVTDATALQRSDDICTALQLINFWQDLSVDVPRGRYYLTREDRARFGVSQDDVIACRQTTNATKLIASYADSAGLRMQNGSKLVHQIPGRAGWELRLVVQGGLRILDKIAAQGYTTLLKRPRLTAWDFPIMLWRSLWM
jgi:squalene synthase HpnC